MNPPGRPSNADKQQARDLRRAGVPVPQIAAQLGFGVRAVYRWTEDRLPPPRPLIRMDWHQDALCREMGDPDTWHPERGGKTTAEAIRICRLCDVQAECLQYALDAGEQAGIWGGYTPKERQRLKRGRAA